jgi:hypothetical protein
MSINALCGVTVLMLLSVNTATAQSASAAQVSWPPPAVNWTQAQGQKNMLEQLGRSFGLPAAVRSMSVSKESPAMARRRWSPKRMTSGSIWV